MRVLNVCKCLKATNKVEFKGKILLNWSINFKKLHKMGTALV